MISAPMSEKLPFTSELLIVVPVVNEVVTANVPDPFLGITRSSACYCPWLFADANAAASADIPPCRALTAFPGNA